MQWTNPWKMILPWFVSVARQKEESCLPTYLPVSPSCCLRKNGINKKKLLLKNLLEQEYSAGKP